MLTFLLAIATAAEPIELLNKLFPSASVQNLRGGPALPPIVRKGELGLIRVEHVSAVPMADGRMLLGFRLETTDIGGEEPNMDVLEGSLKRMRECGDGNVEECAEICKGQGYPLETTLTPVTLAK